MERFGPIGSNCPIFTRHSSSRLCAFWISKEDVLTFSILSAEYVYSNDSAVGVLIAV